MNSLDSLAQKIMNWIICNKQDKITNQKEINFILINKYIKIMFYIFDYDEML